MILDAGFLISVDRAERTAQTFLTAAVRRGTPLHTTHPVVAQVWRNGARQARLARFLDTIAIHPLAQGHVVGAILARSRTTDVVDAHLVAMALQLNEPILTGDTDDLNAIAAALPDRQPRVFAWP